MAIIDYTNALEFDDTLSEVYYNRGYFYHKKKNKDDHLDRNGC